MNHDHYSDDYIRTFLKEMRSFAIVGASANPVRPSYFVLKYLVAKGYAVHPVNPGYAGQAIAGRHVHASLSEIGEPVDVVDIFRNSEAAFRVTEEAIAIGAKAVWMQLGVRNDEAAKLAESAGLKVVMNRCPKIEYARLCGEIGWNGINSRTLSSRRPVLSGTGYQKLKLSGETR